MDINTNLSDKKNISNIILEKDVKIKELEDKLSKSSFEEMDINNLICISIMSYDESFKTNIICKKSNTFKNIEENFYLKYPEYSKLNCYFTKNQDIIDKYKSLGEYKIQNDDIIILNIK